MIYRSSQWQREHARHNSCPTHGPKTIPINNAFYNSLGLKIDEAEFQDFEEEAKIYSKTGYTKEWLNQDLNECSQCTVISNMKLEGHRAGVSNLMSSSTRVDYDYLTYDTPNLSRDNGNILSSERQSRKITKNFKPLHLNTIINREEHPIGVIREAIKSRDSETRKKDSYKIFK